MSNNCEIIIDLPNKISHNDSNNHNVIIIKSQLEKN